MLVGIVIASSTVSTVEAAQLDAFINPNSDTSKFDIRYQKTIFIEYPDGGDVRDSLHGKTWSITERTSPGSPDSQNIRDIINQNIFDGGSQARTDNLDITYSAKFTGNPTRASIDYTVLIKGDITNYVILEGEGQNPTLIDMGWRAISIYDKVEINGVEINQPLSALETNEPEIASFIRGSEAEPILTTPLIFADFIRDQPLGKWHFLFDPTGISSDADRFGLDDSISGSVFSKYTMGESSLREGILTEKEFEGTFDADKTYNVKTLVPIDIATLEIIGFAERDTLDGIDVLGVRPTAPTGSGGPQNEGFTVSVVYGMAGVAAIGGIAFFLFSSRQVKKDSGQGQTGIDPSRLVGYATSQSAGGYQTNRGEAQLRDDVSYQQTRNVYDSPDSQTLPSSTTAPPPPPPQTESSASAATTTAQEAACGCAASAEMGSECDCQMQGSCLCDADCACGSSVCKEHSGSF